MEITIYSRRRIATAVDDVIGREYIDQFIEKNYITETETFLNEIERKSFLLFGALVNIDMCIISLLGVVVIGKISNF